MEKKFGRFTEMSREDVQAYLERRGFAVYDQEWLDDLREAAFLDESCEKEWNDEM